MFHPMVPGHVPWNVSFATSSFPATGAAVVAGALLLLLPLLLPEARRVELPRTVTVCVTVGAAAQDEAAVVVTGSVHASPVMKNLDVWA